MNIIPVLDLKNNRVVHAKQGQREHYQALNTPLSASADAFKVIEAFLGLHAFDTFYIADLDAITGAGNHDPLLQQLAAAYPDLIFWLDQGYRQTPAKPTQHWPVIGSESYSDNQLNELARFNNRFILSLDYAAASPLGAGRLFNDSDGWPERIIIMTLAKVGSNSGPDFDKLRHYVQNYPNKNFIAAGGIRNAEDLRALSQLGVNHALVASSLHSGAINADEITELSSRHHPIIGSEK